VTGVGPELAPSDFLREVSLVKASQRRSILYHPLDGRYPSIRAGSRAFSATWPR
jgi:hypothetical protein